MTRIGKLDYPGLPIRMYVSTDVEAQYRLNACAKEPWTVAWIESFPPNSVLYDVGACVGSYTLLAAALGHTVVAIEPSFANFNRLCENVLLNDLGPRVLPLCIAVGASGGSMPLMQQEPAPGYSGGSQRLQVPLLPLVVLPGLFGVPPPTHVKIDVDGNELAVLQGAGWLAGSFMVEHRVTTLDSGKGPASPEQLAAAPDAYTHPDSQAAKAFLEQAGYTRTQHWPGYGHHPIVLYSLWQRSIP